MPTKTAFSNPCQHCDRAWVKGADGDGHCYFWEHEPAVCNRFQPGQALTEFGRVLKTLNDSATT